MGDDQASSPAEESIDRPEWDDEYLDRVADRLAFNYDLERDRRVDGEDFDLYGRMEMASKKHFFHPALQFGYHESFEHLFARRQPSITVAGLERLVGLGHDLADEWVVPDEQHFSTEFTFATVVDRIPDDVREFVSGFRERTLIRYGYFGHYEIHLLVVAPDREDLVASQKAQLAEAFRLWQPIEKQEPGLWQLITRRLQI